MLVSLEIKNFLLIKKISIDLIKGFNTFTGETGAGKSIIIDALKLALGGKNYSNHNLKDNETTSIKAVFEINQKIKDNLDSLNIEIEDDYLIVERQIDINQKSKILLNNQIASLTAVKKALGNIIEFQENYEQQELYNNKYFLDFIDKTGSIDTSGLKEKFRIFQNFKFLLKFPCVYRSSFINKIQKIFIIIKFLLFIILLKFNYIAQCFFNSR